MSQFFWWVKQKNFLMEKHFFLSKHHPPFYYIFFSFEAFPHLGKDSAQNFYNYKYQNVFWSTLLYPLLYDLVLKSMFIVLNNKYLGMFAPSRQMMACVVKVMRRVHCWRSIRFRATILTGGRGVADLRSKFLFKLSSLNVALFLYSVNQK